VTFHGSDNDELGRRPTLLPAGAASYFLGFGLLGAGFGFGFGIGM
jgi:hypothetical protein